MWKLLITMFKKTEDGATIVSSLLASSGHLKECESRPGEPQPRERLYLKKPENWFQEKQQDGFKVTLEADPAIRAIVESSFPGEVWTQMMRCPCGESHVLSYIGEEIPGAVEYVCPATSSLVGVGTQGPLRGSGAWARGPLSPKSIPAWPV